MRVLLADDHPLFRDGIASLLRSWGHEVVGQAGTADEAVRLCSDRRPDLVLMDVRMPGSGLSATRAITAAAAETGATTAIVMLTASEDEDDLFEAIKAGAQGYLLKNLESSQFRAMLEAVERGEAAITPATAVRILEEYRHGDRGDNQPVGARGGAGGPEAGAAAGGPDRLTDRELEVLGLVTAGLRNKEIAARLQVSENTAKFHLRNILEKLHAGSRTELAARAVREGLVPPDPADAKAEH
ncbi:MAG: response regulator transcription factor [Chloroflexi bacterium]|nr:response regulator transcription factor [Chloroflexota bacterium]